MGNIIYYFTGTGNSLAISKLLGSALGDTELVRVRREAPGLKRGETHERIGFVFPVYYRGLPHMLADFIQNVDIDGGAYVFAVANYGGSSALALRRLETLLAERGAKLHGAFGMPMPGSMWSMYYNRPRSDVTERLAAQDELAAAIAGLVRGKTAIPPPAVLNAGEAEEFYRQISGVSQRDRGFWCGDSCVGCGICAKICPADNIVLDGGKPVWLHRCEYCPACLHWCPAQAIQLEDVTAGRERYHNPAVDVRELFLR